MRAINYCDKMQLSRRSIGRWAAAHRLQRRHRHRHRHRGPASVGHRASPRWHGVERGEDFWAGGAAGAREGAQGARARARGVRARGRTERAAAGVRSGAREGVRGARTQSACARVCRAHVQGRTGRAPSRGRVERAGRVCRAHVRRHAEHVCPGTQSARVKVRGARVPGRARRGRYGCAERACTGVQEHPCVNTCKGERSTGVRARRARVPRRAERTRRGVRCTRVQARRALHARVRGGRVLGHATRVCKLAAARGASWVCKPVSARRETCAIARVSPPPPRQPPSNSGSPIPPA